MTLKSNLQKFNIVSPNHSLMMIDLKTLCVMHFDNILGHKYLRNLIKKNIYFISMKRKSSLVSMVTF